MPECPLNPTVPGGPDPHSSSLPQALLGGLQNLAVFYPLCIFF